MNTDLNLLTLSVYSFNPRAQRLYEKAGFVLVSVDEAELECEGSMIDSLNMMLTRQSWESRNKNIFDFGIAFSGCLWYYNCNDYKSVLCTFNGG